MAQEESFNASDASAPSSKKKKGQESEPCGNCANDQAPLLVQCTFKKKNLKLVYHNHLF